MRDDRCIMFKADPVRLSGYLKLKLLEQSGGGVPDNAG